MTDWTLLGARFETPEFLTGELRQMVQDMVDELPDDDPTKKLWQVLPMPPGWEI